MKKRIYLWGSCDNPSCPHPVHSKQVNAIIQDSDLAPMTCPACHQGHVSWSRFSVSHRPRLKPGIWILVAAVSLVLLCAGAAVLLVRNRSYTPIEMQAARQHIENKSAAELCKFLPGSAEYKASLLRVSPQTVRRIQNGESEPGPVVTSALKGLAAQRALDGAIGFRLRRHYPYDAYVGQKN